MRWCGRSFAKPEQPDLDAVLRGAAALRAQLPPIDGVELARQSRADLEARGA